MEYSIRARARAVWRRLMGREEFLSDLARKLVLRLIRKDVWFFDRMFKFHGSLRSPARLGPRAKDDFDVHSQYKDKAEIAMTVGSSWYGGDYFEFGSQELHTFRNMLSAYDICRMTRSYPDVRFYAFDVFGTLRTDCERTRAEVETFESASQYFAPFTKDGDLYQQHMDLLEEHKVLRDRCTLIQGLFQDTLTKERKEGYKREGRRVGFAFLDCNVGPSYRLAFEFVFDLLAENSYVYMDEYFQNPEVIQYFDQFVEALRDQRGIGCVYLRNAGGFGALFRLYPLSPALRPLELSLG